MPARVSTRALSRRGLFAAGGAGLVGLSVGGCAATLPGSSSDPAPAPRAAASLSPDVGLATLALAEIAAVREAVAATAAAYPGLAAPLDPVAAMHQAHEDALVDAVPPRAAVGSTPAAYAVPTARPDALAQLQARETDLQTRLVGLAVQARSGAFASLLAAMSAGTAQRVATWPT